MVQFVRKVLFLQEGELSRLFPFFLCYLLLSAALAIGDGLSQALFVHRVGASSLPLYYGITAVVNLLLIGWYLFSAERLGNERVFQWIIGGSAATYALTWLALHLEWSGSFWYGMLFVSREVSYTLIILHFGTFLQDYFTRLELNRVLPIVYSGGRLGGLVGGMLLERLTPSLGLMNIILILVGLGVCSMFLVRLIALLQTQRNTPEDVLGDPGVAVPRAADGSDLEEEAHRTFRGFFRYLWASPLLFWMTVTSVFFIACRWVLNFQYNAYFGQHFANAEEMAIFLGQYTQVALLASMLVQLLLVNRLVAWMGIKGTHLLYSLLMLVGFACCLGTMTLGIAIFCRLLETELRFGLRNPIAQLITNKFSKRLRIRVRSWSLGFLLPLGTLASSGLLSGMVALTSAAGTAWLGVGVGLGYFLTSFGLYGSFTETTVLKEVTVPKQEQDQAA